jgi:alpha-tubulin suppressor-like RCC1 family protein
MAWGCN